MRTRSVLSGFAGLLVAGSMVFVACGDDDDSNADGAGAAPTQVVSDSGAVSNSMVAPNTFLTFEGDRYRLQSLEQANLSGADSGYAEAGTASEADIDQDDLTVYRRDGEPDAVYTYAAAQGEGEEGTPALWYRWAPEP